MSEQYTPQEKAAWITWQLATGNELTTQDVMAQFNISHQGASYIMIGLSRVTPIYRTEQSRWRRFNSTT